MLKNPTTFLILLCTLIFVSGQQSFAHQGDGEDKGRKGGKGFFMCFFGDGEDHDGYWHYSTDQVGRPQKDTDCKAWAPGDKWVEQDPTVARDGSKFWNGGRLRVCYQYAVDLGGRDCTELIGDGEDTWHRGLRFTAFKRLNPANISYPNSLSYPGFPFRSYGDCLMHEGLCSENFTLFEGNNKCTDGNKENCVTHGKGTRIYESATGRYYLCAYEDALGPAGPNETSERDQSWKDLGSTKWAVRAGCVPVPMAPTPPDYCPILSPPPPYPPYPDLAEVTNSEFVTPKIHVSFKDESNLVVDQVTLSCTYSNSGEEDCGEAQTIVDHKGSSRSFLPYMNDLHTEICIREKQVYWNNLTQDLERGCVPRPPIPEVPTVTRIGSTMNGDDNDIPAVNVTLLGQTERIEMYETKRLYGREFSIDIFADNVSSNGNLVKDGTNDVCLVGYDAPDGIIKQRDKIAGDYDRNMDGIGVLGDFMSCNDTECSCANNACEPIPCENCSGRSGVSVNDMPNNDSNREQYDAWNENIYDGGPIYYEEKVPALAPYAMQPSLCVNGPAKPSCTRITSSSTSADHGHAKWPTVELEIADILGSTETLYLDSDIIESTGCPTGRKYKHTDGTSRTGTYTETFCRYVPTDDFKGAFWDSFGGYTDSDGRICVDRTKNEYRHNNMPYRQCLYNPITGVANWGEVRNECRVYCPATNYYKAKGSDGRGKDEFELERENTGINAKYYCNWEDGWANEWKSSYIPCYTSHTLRKPITIERFCNADGTWSQLYQSPDTDDPITCNVDVDYGSGNSCSDM